MPVVLCLTGGHGRRKLTSIPTECERLDLEAVGDDLLNEGPSDESGASRHQASFQDG